MSQLDASQRFKLLKQLLSYLEESGGLSKMISDLTSACQLNELAFASVKSLDLSSDATFDIGEIEVLPIVSQQLPLPNFRISTACDLARPTTHPVSVSGIIVRVSTTCNFTRATRYFCTDSTCKVASGLVRIFTVGATEREVVRDGFRCPVCSQILQEDVRARMLDVKVSLQVLPGVNFVRFTRPLTCIVRGASNADALTLGKYADFLGFPLRSIDSQGNVVFVLEVFNVQCFNSLTYCKECPDRLASVPPEIRQCVYGVSLLLAFNFCSDVTPCGSWITAKLILLLLLLVEPQHVSFCLMARDSRVFDRLLQRTLTFSPRHVVHRSGNSVHFSVSSDSEAVEGGTLSLASSGIAYFPYLSKLKKSELSTISGCLDNKLLTAELRGGSVYSQPLDCGIWALVDKQECLKHPVVTDSTYEGHAGVWGHLPDHLQSVVVRCDLFLECEDPREEEVAFFFYEDKDLCDPQVSQEFSQLLANGRRLMCTFQDDAECLLKRYFLAGRKSYHEMTGFKVSCLQTLTSLAVSHARLCGRDAVLSADVIVAIFLHELSLSSLFGTSSFSIKYLGHVEEVSVDVVQEFDLNMQAFHCELLHFIALNDTGLEE